MYIYRLDRIRFNNATEIAPGSLTVVIGPNNSGKSRFLKDIAEATAVHAPRPGTVASQVDWAKPTSLTDLRQSYDVERYPTDSGGWGFRTLQPTLCKESNVSGGPQWPEEFESMIKQENPQHERLFAHFFGSALIAFLTTEDRLLLVKESASASHERQAANLLQLLYNAGPETEKAIRKVVKTAFGSEVALDFTVPQNLKFRVGDDFKDLPEDPRRAKSILEKYEKLDDQGDGLRSFAGVVVALSALKRSVVLIDEPEAFLHPPQAFRIGEFLVDHASPQRQIFVATHSADVLRGIISKTRDVTILRIERQDRENTFCRLEPERLNAIACDPLLSSARVLDGLFYAGAIVVEADSDSRFYHAVSHKLRRDLDLHFVNADNKQTVARIVRLYRDMGLRAGGIVDFDFLNEKGLVQQTLNEIAVNSDDQNQAIEIRDEIGKIAEETPTDERIQRVKQAVNGLNATVEAVFSKTYSSEDTRKKESAEFLQQLEGRCREITAESKGWRKLKTEGRTGLPTDVAVRFDKLWEICASHGLFINHTGELESMLKDYAIKPTTDKRSWITQALTLVAGLQPDLAKDPWKFMAAVHKSLLPLERTAEGDGEVAETLNAK